MPYLNVTEVESAIQALSTTYPGLCELITLPNSTHEGRTSHAIKIGLGPLDNRPSMLFVGGQHAREWGSCEICVNFAADLLEAYDLGTGLTYGGKTFTSTEVQMVIEESQIFVFPCVNPDGRNHSQTRDDLDWNNGAGWRRNRNPVAPVDLNRNYDFQWDFNTALSPSSNPVVSDDPNDPSQTYHGPAPESEPETRNVVWLLDMYPQIRWLIDIHSYSQLLHTVWGDDENQTTDPTQNFMNPIHDGARGVPGDAYGEFVCPGDLTASNCLVTEMQGALYAVRGVTYATGQSFNVYSRPCTGTASDYPYSRHFADPIKTKVLSFLIEWGTEFQPLWSEMENIILDVSSALVAFSLAAPSVCPIVRNCTFVTDRSTYGEDEVAAMLLAGSPARFDKAFYIIVDGFSPQELGITSLDTPETAPTIIMDPSVEDMTVVPDVVPDDPYFKAEYPDPGHLNCPQRLTWRYRVEFTSTTAFTFPEEMPLEVTLTASVASVSDEAIVRLVREASPYELDGETHWLSDDLRVFQVGEGGRRFGVDLEGSTPEAVSAFIINVIQKLNDPSSDTDGETFEDISRDQETWLYSEDVGGTRVFYFAVARVRYRSAESAAENVRVFFRLFPWATTSLEYDRETAYRRGGSGDVTIPLLGIQDGAFSTIPCFAEQRIDTETRNLNQQTDPDNERDIPLDESGDEKYAYFGCWLDFNQPDQYQFPFYPAPGEENGPFPTDREPILEHIRGKHQCLVAEIAFDPDPIPDEATPTTSDKLAQRNLAIVESANPGEPASRRIPHTFDIRPTPATLEADELPDELMIDWGNTPSGSLATIYMPSINAAAVLDRATEMYGSHRLTRVDEHTLQCQADGITYMPIPAGIGANLAGLLSVDLPETVVRGDAYAIVVHQVTNAQGVVLAHDPDTPPPEPLSWRRILGSFQLTIPVRAKEELLEPEARLLSVLRWIQRAIPDDDRWFAVFRRYVDQIAARVDALGGNASEVVPSPSGNWQASKAVIRARQPWNETGIWLEAGKTYQFTATGKWTDGLITTDADGYRLWPLILFEGLRRAPEFNWFALIGTIGRTEATRFLIGSGTQYTPPQSGYLYCFANNTRWLYWNNFGQINLEVREV